MAAVMREASSPYAWEDGQALPGLAEADDGLGMTPSLSAALGAPLGDDWSPSRSSSFTLPPLAPRTNALHSVPRGAALERLDWEDQLAGAEAQQPENESIRVAARFRPLSAEEAKDSGKLCVRFAGDGRSCELVDDFNARPFSFNNMFEPDSQQEDVYRSVAQPIVQGVIDGYNGAIIAYGQTGSGKTHTMLGPGGASAFIQQNAVVDWNEVGIIPRAVQELVDYASASDGRVQLRASYVEIYQEHIIDLLGQGVGGVHVGSRQQEGALTSAHLRESQDTLYLPEVTETPLVSLGDAMGIMRKGNVNRHQAETLMNRNSSRSHAVFIVTVTNVEDASRQKYAQLYLVDLAGSERIYKTGVSGARLDEAKKINLGLLALGQVIHSLARKLKHIPYRDSKLTQLLRNCLGGNARTLVMVSVSPHASNASETLSAMRFGSRASLIQNKTKANIAEDPWMLKKMLERARADLNELRGHCRVLQAQVAAFHAAGLPALPATPPKPQLPALPPSEPSTAPPSAPSSSAPSRVSTPGSSDGQLGALHNFTEKRLLVWSLLPSLVCPLTRSIMREPVNAADGWTYERRAILEHIAKAGRKLPHSPVTGQLLPSRLVTPCHIVTQLVKLHLPDLPEVATPLPPITKLNVWLAREICYYLDAKSLARAERAWPFMLSASNQGLLWRRRLLEDYPARALEAVEESAGDEDGQQGADASAMAWRRRYAALRDAEGGRTAACRPVQKESKGLTLRKA